MADQRDLLNALKYQLGQWIDSEYTTLNAGGGVSTGTDIKESIVYHIEPFEPENPESYSAISWATEPNYNIVITNSRMGQTPDYPTGYLRYQFNCDILLIRKTLRVKDHSNNRNLVMFGGDDGAGNDVTSISKLASDLTKWFRSSDYGSRLNDGTEDNSFKCDVTSVSEIQNANEEGKKTNYWYVVCEFQALTLEDRTITAA